MSVINQKDYLKKYLKIGKGSGDKKKKKKTEKTVLKGLKIIDDDADTALSREIQDDLDAANEDAPQIVAVIDERPPSLRIDEEKNSLWQPIGQATTTSTFHNFNIGSIKLNINKEQNLDRRKESLIDRNRDYPSSSRKKQDYSPVKHNNDDDYSPPRKHKNNYQSSPERKRSDQSPSRRGDVHSPPRRHENDQSPSRRKDIDQSPPRRRGDHESPPRRKGVHLSPLRRGGENQSSATRTGVDQSPPRRKDIDQSPPRRKDIDQSLTRQRDDKSPPRRKGVDQSPPRRKDSNQPIPRRKDDQSPPERKENDKSLPRRKGNDQSPPRRRENDQPSKRIQEGDHSPPRKKRNGCRSPLRKETGHSPVKKTRKSRWGDEELASPSYRKLEKPETTMSGKTSGLQNAKNLVADIMRIQKDEEEMFKAMPADISGATAATVRRKQKPEDEPDPEKEAREKELKEKYCRWGKGMKQVQDESERMADQLKEMNKPLARYADDADLEKYLRDQEREGDPMLAYIRKKKKKVAVERGVPEKPTYLGDFMPNRFAVPPGYRWDGVDRSNGYEQKWVEAQNSRKAMQEEAMQWSQEDM